MPRRGAEKRAEKNRTKAGQERAAESGGPGADSAPDDSDPLAIGTDVMVQGLAKAAHHNGLLGIVGEARPDDSGGEARFAIKLTSGATISCKRANFRRLKEGQDTITRSGGTGELLWREVPLQFQKAVLEAEADTRTEHEITASPRCRNGRFAPLGNAAAAGDYCSVWSLLVRFGHKVLEYSFFSFFPLPPLCCLP